MESVQAGYENKYRNGTSVLGRDKRAWFVQRDSRETICQSFINRF